MKNLFIKLFSILVLIFLLMFTGQFNVEYPFTESHVSITFNEADARTEWENMELKTETCWETGEEFQICRTSSETCEDSSQGTCGSTDPEVD